MNMFLTLAGQRRRNENVVHEGFANCSRQVHRHPCLHDVPGRSGGKASAYKIRIGMHGQENDLRPATRLFQFVGGFDARQHGHGNIDHQNICIQFACEFDERLAIASRTHNVKARFEQPLRVRQDVRMIVCQENSHFFQIARPRNQVENRDRFLRCTLTWYRRPNVYW